MGLDLRDKAEVHKDGLLILFIWNVSIIEL